MENQTQNEEPCCQDHQSSCQRRFQMIFNIVAGVAIVFLLILQFFNPFAKKPTQVVGSDGGTASIAYVVTDSIMSGYTLVDTLDARKQRFSDSLDKDYEAKRKGFQARLNAYQQNMQNGKITTVDEARKIEEQLGAEQEKLVAIQETYLGMMQQQQMNMQLQILDSIVSVIKSYPEEFPYDYVLGYAKGGGILYASDKLDITGSVMEKLNQRYKPE